jgi:hypothetical protein
MDHPKRLSTPDHRAPKPTSGTGLGWAEFFQWLGQQSVTPERRSPSSRPIRE